MGRKSIKQNKNPYQTAREELELSREAASEILDGITPERIEKIENERSVPNPDEVLLMAHGYKRPSLCNYYCSHECPIGQQYVPQVQIKELSSIVLEMLASLNSVNKKKERLIEITADGKIDTDEIEDFIYIQEELERIRMEEEARRLREQEAERNRLEAEAERQRLLKKAEEEAERQRLLKKAEEEAEAERLRLEQEAAVQAAVIEDQQNDISKLEKNSLELQIRIKILNEYKLQIEDELQRLTKELDSLNER